MALLTWLAASWDLEPGVLVPLAVGTLLYVAGFRRLRARGARSGLVAPWRAWCFAAGMAVFLAALSSPLSHFDDVYFWVHMVQHLLLILVAAPLTLLGAPLLPILWGLPAGWRRGVSAVLVGPKAPVRSLFQALTNPFVAVTVLVAAVAIWHVPVFYDAAQGDTPLHYLEHATFVGTALLYWWGIVHPSGGRRRLGYGFAIPYLLPPLLEGILVGALLTFAGQPMYAYYADEVRPIGGLSALQDQQLAGLIMWVPSGLVYLLVLMLVLALFMRQEEQRARDQEAYDRAQSSSASVQALR